MLFRYWLDLCLLRAAPQDGPSSIFILGFTLTCYAMVSVLVMTGSYGMVTGARMAVVELILLSTFIVVLLYLRGKPARIRQTLSAMTGAGSLLGLLALPVVIMAEPNTGNGFTGFILPLAWITLLFWNLAVSAHIIRHALSMSYAIGVAVSFLYMLFSTQFVVKMFPQQLATIPAG